MSIKSRSARRMIAVVAIALCLAMPLAARAHFLWLLVDAKQPIVHLYFGEAADPDDPALLDNVAASKFWQRTTDGKVVSLEAAKGDESIEAKPQADLASTDVFGVELTYGVISRGKGELLLKYYGKTPGQAALKDVSACAAPKQLALDIAPELNGNELELVVTWKGEPLKGSEVVVAGPGLDDPLKGTTDDAGRFSVRLVKPGVFSIRAKHVESAEGTHDGKAYQSVSHYSTLALPFEKP